MFLSAPRVALVCAAALAACAGRASTSPAPSAAAAAPGRYPAGPSRLRPLTRAERTGFRETSRYADVVQFLDSLQALGADVARGNIGTTTEGRAIPYVVLSRPLVRTPAEARRLGRPVVYVQANIHAGEVEGKEALQALIRDLSLQSGANVLDSIVLVAVPIYNADGNERFAPQARNRTEQNGPELVGTRANAQGLDLNRDYVKAEAPETRASLAMFAAWDPDLFVDLHTTDGSFHGYALTYSPSLNPAALGTGPWVRDSLLPEVRRRVRQREGYETFDYGNFAPHENWVPPDPPPRAWETYDSRPRFGTNYYGLRGRLSVLSEAYSHDPFERRVASTYAFVSELLSLVAERASRIRALEFAREARSRVTVDGVRLWETGTDVPLRARLTDGPFTAPVLVEQLARTGDTVPGAGAAGVEPGVPRGLRRTGRVVAVPMQVADRFDAMLSRPLPFAYAISPAARDSLLPRLRLHGVVVEQLDEAATVIVSTFAIDSVLHAARPFQGHHETQVAGRWSDPAPRTLPAGTLIVRAGQPLGIVAAYLLEPESDDGLATWNALDPLLAPGGVHPVARVVQSAPIRTHPLR